VVDGNACLAFLVGSGDGDVLEMVGLVVELHGHMLQRSRVFARVVSTKQ
jgi:hypothetical protein